MVRESVSCREISHSPQALISFVAYITPCRDFNLNTLSAVAYNLLEANPLLYIEVFAELECEITLLKNLIVACI